MLLTHLHSDHIGDLGEVATQSWLGGRKVPLQVYGPPAPEASERVTDAEGEIFGVAGTEAVVKGFAEAYNSTPISASRKATISCRPKPRA